MHISSIRAVSSELADKHPKCREFPVNKGVHSSIKGQSGKYSVTTLTPKHVSAADVSIPGFGKLFAANYTMLGRVVWGLAITLCFSICVFQIVNRILTYLETPVDIQVDIIRNETIRFPAITICPLYPFRKSNEMYKLRILYAATFNISYDNEDDLPEKVDAMDLLDLPNVNTTYLWKLTRIGSVDVHPTCGLTGKKTCDFEISSDDLETLYGMCTTHSFNRDIKYEGNHNGYEVKLKNYENHPHSSMKWTTMVLVHEKHDIPRHKVYLEKGQVVYPNYETILTVSIKEYRRFNTHSRPCQSQAKFQACISQCIEDHISKKVSCRLPYMTKSFLPNCTRAYKASCTERATRKVYHKWGAGKVCSRCPRKCVENIYSVGQNTVWPRKYTHLKVLLQGNTIDVVTESPSFSFNVLVSDIGGNLGLFLGVCVLTGLQILEMIVGKIYHRITLRH